MRRLQKFWAVVLVLGVFSEQGSAGGEPAEASRTADRPNILFILADDLGVYDLGCYGRTEHHTPHLDRLASQGVRFTCAYAASPVCSPSRAAILTGKDPARLHLTTFLPGRPDAPSQKLLQPKIAMQLPLEETTLAEYLKQAGYATACIGKWHLGGKGFGPAEQGFDFVHPGQANTTPSETEGGKGEYDLTAAAERFIQQNRQRPFFLYLCHNSPHIPYTARQALVEKNAKAFEPVYAAVIETLDDAVGRLLETLDRLGLADRTMVIFTSDNGGLHVPEGPHRLVTHNGPFRAGKGFLYEGGLRIPLIVRWPGRVPAGNIIDQPMIHTDWTPTLLDLVGLPVPKDLDGQSMARLLCPDSPAKSDLPGSSPVATKGQPTAPRPKTIPSGPLPEVLEKASSGGTERLLFWHFPHYTNQGGRPGGAVRQGPWKLIQQYETGQLELYNLDQDVGETQNLADKMPELANRLRQDLENWCKQIGAQENRPNPDFDPALHRALYIDADPSKFHPQKASPAQIDRMQQWRRQMNAALPQTERPKPKTKASPKPVPSSENPTVQHPQQSPAQPSSVGPSPAGQSLAKPSTAEHSSATRIPTQQVPPEPLPAEYSPAKQAARPNIVIILADDLGYSDLGCYGGEIETPHLDRLAAGGLRFTQCYNSARCWPSRAALMTGYYPQQVRRDTVPGVRSGAQAPRPPWAPLVSEMLRQHGYRCYHSGKWHIDGSPLAGGFDHSYLLEDHNRFFTPKNHMEDDRPLPPPKPEDGYYATSAIAQYAIKYLQQHHQQYPHRPFFLYLCFTAPHFPLQAPQEAVARYLDRYKIGWNQIQQQRGQRLRQMGLVGHDPPPMERHLGPPYHFPEALKILGPGEVNRPIPWQELSPEQQAFQAAKMAVHAAMVHLMDEAIGQLLQQIRKMNAWENTLIVFASDNGASAEIMVRGDGHDPKAPPGSAQTFLCLGPGWSSAANTPFRRHKVWVHEGGISTPLIVHWPAGIRSAGQLRHTPVHFIDLFATVLELAGISAPESWQGHARPPLPAKSLVPLFEKDGTVQHEYFWFLHEGHRAIRVGDWKLVAARGDPWELYHLAHDRGETKNLIHQYPEKAQELETLWNRLWEQFQQDAKRDLPPEDLQPKPKAKASSPTSAGRNTPLLCSGKPLSEGL